MEEQNNILRKPSFRFSSIPNGIILDEKLSAKAKGILVYFLCRPDGWKFYASEIVRHFADGKDSIRSGINELCEKGYLKVFRTRNEQGYFTGWVYDILLDEDGEKPENGKPENGKPDFGDAATNNTDYKSNTDINKTDCKKEEKYIKKKSSEDLPMEGLEEVVSNNSKPSKSSQKKELEKQAMEIYELYPRKAQRPSAIKAILRALKVEGYTNLYTKTQNYAKAVKESLKEVSYIPYPATWFNNEEYNDDWSGLKEPQRPNYRNGIDRKKYDAYGNPYRETYDRTQYGDPNNPDECVF